MKVCTTCGSEWPDDTKFCPNDASALRPSTDTADLVGTVIAERYHIVEKLGEGGMGAVYLGEHVKMGLKVAIKVMAQAIASDPDAIARFNREAKNAARIKHPNVCAIHDFGETPDGLIYLAMEFIEGESLTDLLKREGALSPQRAVSILRQCSEALQSAHDLGIAHRDLKPDNIMITEARDGTDIVKLVDFGIAKAVTGEAGQTVTKSGLVVGTPEYMSPEQVSGDVLDGRSDIYSLGLVFFRILTGSLPFQTDTLQDALTARLLGEPMKLQESVPGADFPPRLQEVMDRALATSRSDRYASAIDFGKDAVDAVSGMPTTAPQVDLEGATHLIDTGGTADRAGIMVSGAESRAPTPETPQPVPQAARRRTRTRIVVGGIATVAAAFALWLTAPWQAGKDATEVPPAIAPSETPVGQETPDVAQTATPAEERRQPADQPPAAPPPTERAGQTVTDQPEDSVIRPMRLRALDARSRAVEAGATSSELAKGDSLIGVAESLAQQDRVSEALLQLSALPRKPRC